MSNEALLHVLGYVWTFFGASWVSFNLLKAKPGESSPASRLFRLSVLMITFAVLFAGRSRIPPALLLVFGVAWAWLGARWAAPSKGVHSGEFKWYRSFRLLVLAGVFALLFWSATAVGFLATRFVPDIPTPGLAGFIAAITGMALALWSRFALGKYWSDKVIVQAEHQLIRTGPYSCMRHPLYSGVLLAVLGTAVLLGEIRGLLSFAVLLVNYAIKAKREERILAERFGSDFELHVRSTGFLLPRFRRS
jgi:protein-S-isoprenylcysteine O-methyltransferase Ste14